MVTTFAAFDLSMSLNAEWFSTMYGVYFFAGCVLVVPGDLGAGHHVA